MRRSLATFTIVVLGTPVAFSQSTVTASPGVEVSIPVGDFAEEAGTGYGISGRIQFSPSTGLGLIGTVGYVWWGSKGTVDATTSHEALQAMGGLKLYVLKGVYALAEAGVYLVTANFSSTWIETGSSTETRLMFSAGAGGEIGDFEFEAKYVGSQFAREHNASIRLGYRFAL